MTTSTFNTLQYGAYCRVEHCGCFFYYTVLLTNAGTCWFHWATKK